MTRSAGVALGEVDPGESKPVPDVRSEPVSPPPRRQRRTAPNPRQIRLPMLPAGAELDPDTGAVARDFGARPGECPMDRTPGICPVLRCRHNLLLDERAGALLIGGGTRGRGHGAHFPLERTASASVPTLLPAHVAEAAAEAVVQRADYLADRWGTTCVIEIGGPLTLAEVGDALGVTREMARQEEAKALRKLGRGRAATVEAWRANGPPSEEPRRQGRTVTVGIRRSP